MILKYSESNIPYIEFSNGDKLIFSVTSKNHDKGFRFLCFSGLSCSTVCVSGNKAKKNPKYQKIVENINFTTDMFFNKIPRNAKQTLTPIKIGYLKKVFNDFINDGYFPDDNLKKLEVLLNSSEDNTDECDNDETATESYDDIQDVSKKKPVKRTIKIKPRKIGTVPQSFKRV